MSLDLRLTVNGQDLTQYMVDDGWSISQNWSRQGDTATFTLVDEHEGRSVLSFTVGPLSTVLLADAGAGQTLFSGVVPKPLVAFAGPNLAQWQLDCVDWTMLSDLTLVAGDYTGLTASELAIAVTQQANCGIAAASTASGGFVAPGPQIPRVQFNYLSLTQAWTKISKLASLQATYGWYVDENRQLHFDMATAAPSSGLTFSDDIAAVDNVTTVGYDNDSLTYEWDATSIRNTITVRGADYNSTETDLFVGNGNQVSFPLTFRPDANNIGQATLLVGGVAKTVSAQTGSSANTDWTIVGNAANQWFLTANTDPAPATSVLIDFTYPYLQPVLSRTSDATSVARFKALPNGGVFAYYVADTALGTLLSAQQRGQREVSTYSQPTERVSLTTTEVFQGHLRAGQLITFANGMVPDSQNSDTPGLSDTFLVVQNNISGVAGRFRTYQITAARI